MIAHFDSFGNYEIPTISLCSPGSAIRYRGKDAYPSKVYGVLREVQNLQIELNFNAPSEITFEITKSLMTIPLFVQVATKMALFVEGYGYFIIEECAETTDYELSVVSKSIRAQSAEIELYQLEVPYIKEGMYKFVDPNTGNGIIDLCAAISPKWKFKFEHIDGNLRGVERYFADTEYENMYDFLVSCLQDKYDCVFEFDAISREARVVTKAQYVKTHETDIHLSRVNVMKRMEKTSSSDDIYTAIKVIGGNGLDIQLVNPIGTNIIYNFAYRMVDMSDDLQSALEKWVATVSYADGSYSTLSNQYAQRMDEMVNIENNLTAAKNKLEAEERKLDNLISKNATREQLGDQKATIESEKLSIYNLQKSYDSKKNQVNQIYSQLESINNECSLSNVATDIDGHPIFTDELLEELSSYIYTAEYSDDNIVKTDSMTNAKKLEQARQLMIRAKEEMEKLSTENFKFTVDTEDLLFNKKFISFSRQLSPGSIIYAESSEDNFEQFHISSVSVDFEESKSTLTFSNKYNKYDIDSIFNDALGDVTKSASSLKRVMSILEDQQNRLKVSYDWIKEAMTLTASHVLASKNQDVVISETGYWGRRLQTDSAGNMLHDLRGNPLYESEQIKIINNGVYITEDSWTTVSAAIGKIQIGQRNDGSPIFKYGVIGDTVIGHMLLGNGLYIEAENDSGATSTIINGDGISVYRGGITIYSNTYGTAANKALYMTSSGDLVLNNIDARSGKIAGWAISSPMISKSTDEFSVEMRSPTEYGTYGNGKADVWIIRDRTKGTIPFCVSSDGSLRATKATITGNIIADSGSIGGCSISNGVLQIGSANIGSLSVSKLTTGTNNKDVAFTGNFTATNANITGNVKAKSGSIGNWNIKDGYFSTEYTDTDTGLKYTLWLTNWGIVQIGGASSRGTKWTTIIEKLGNDLK